MFVIIKPITIERKVSVLKYKILTGSRVNKVEAKLSSPLELILDEMIGKGMTYNEMGAVLGVSVAHIQVWLKKMELPKAKRGARKQPVLTVEELKTKYELSF